MSRDGEPRGRRSARGRADRDARGGRGARAPIWSERAPGSRRPSVTREQIAEQAMAIADADGIDAVSMRRVAGELGVGTMTLYHYVRTKDDLWALIGDRLMGELLVPGDELPGDDWRAALAAIARSTKRIFDRHPWVLGAMHNGRLGPNGLRHFEQSLAAVAAAGLDAVERLEVIALVDDLVFGYALRRGQEHADVHDSEWQQAAQEYAEAMLATGEFPHIEALLGDGDRTAAWRRLAQRANELDRFERGLQALLDGIERRFVAPARGA
jgi:AcrR family transcriptional regulator